MQITRRLILALILVLGSSGLSLADFKAVTYSPQVLADAVSSGKPYLLDYHAPWCLTCRAQERALTNLYSGDSKYNAITIIRVDWDTFKDDAITSDNKVHDRSTLILFKGEKELGRLAWDPIQGHIAALLDKAL